MANVKRIQCGMVNCWLLEGEGGSVLVDTAVVKFKDAILQQVRDSNVKLILLTHGHADHAGNTAYLAERLDVPVAMHRADLELVETGKPRPMEADTILGKLIRNGSVRNIYKAPKFQPVVFMEGGETLDVYGVEGTEIVPLPGHTQGSIGIRVGEGMVVGDTLFNILKPTHARLYEDFGTMQKSLETVRESGCKWIYPGHGKPFAAETFFAEVQD